jgi:hypothetical protein
MGAAASRTTSRAARARVKEKERQRERGTERAASQGKRRTKEAMKAMKAVAVATWAMEAEVLQSREGRSTRDGRHFWGNSARGSSGIGEKEQEGGEAKG